MTISSIQLREDVKIQLSKFKEREKVSGRVSVAEILEKHKNQHAQIKGM